MDETEMVYGLLKDFHIDKQIFNTGFTAGWACKRRQSLSPKLTLMASKLILSRITEVTMPFQPPFPVSNFFLISALSK